MKFVQFSKSLQEGLSPVYLVEGAEAYFRDSAVAQIRAAAGISMPALNETRVEGENLKGQLAPWIARLHTAPFADARRLVRVYEFYPTEREWEILQEYVAKPCPTTVLVFVNTGAKKSEMRRKAGVVFVDCAKESEETLSRWIYSVAKRSNLTMDGDAASMLARYCNCDAARMKKETEKLALLYGAGGRIDRAAVEENVAKDVDYKIYELTQASTRNRGEFLEILYDLMDKGFDESAALSALVSYFRTLTEVSSMRGSDAAVGEALGLNPYAVKKNRETAARLGAERTASLYTQLYALGADMRGGKYSKSGALSAAIAKIFFG